MNKGDNFITAEIRAVGLYCTIVEQVHRVSTGGTNDCRIPLLVIRSYGGRC